MAGTALPLLPDFLCFLYPDVRLTDTDNGTAAGASGFYAASDYYTDSISYHFHPSLPSV